MLNLLNIEKPIMVNNVVYGSSREAYEQLKDFEGEITVVLMPGDKVPSIKSQTGSQNTEPVCENSNASKDPVDPNTYRIQVKKWMTEKSSPGFDFMLKWNNDIPMPLVVMKGKILEETKGMYLMDLHATPEPSSVCFRCGRQLKHPVSILYGIGPECGGHFHINPMNSKEELDAAMDEIKEQMSQLSWKGWVIKSSIKSMDKVEED